MNNENGQATNYQKDRLITNKYKTKVRLTSKRTQMSEWIYLWFYKKDIQQDRKTDVSRLKAMKL